MSVDIVHLSRDELEAGLDHVRAAPSDLGTLELIVQRPAEDMRVVLAEAELNLEEGLAGDNWNQRGSKRSEDGGPHPDMQLNIMNVRILEQIAGTTDRMPLAGDQLIVDLDLSEANLPPWTTLAIGDAVIEITDQPHNGCAKFSRRFGVEAHRFVNSPLGKELHLRGVNARVVSPGTIRQGDTIRKI
ncbi:MAG: MOSC domain-containing protein [Actinomycetota bacterium]